jgi:hypothetical protein
VAGKCEACDPANQDGCGGNQLCCRSGANAPALCTATGTSTQCTACGTPCGGKSADTCTNRGCKCGNNVACGGAAPVCSGGNCVQCADDTDCVGNPNGGVCVNNQCKRCDTTSQRGCALTQLCCADGQGVPACVNTGATRNDICTACGVACNEDATDRCVSRQCKCGAGNPPCGGTTPFCDDQNGNCVQCRNSVDCPAGLQCVNSTCHLCNPQGNLGCAQASTSPICDAQNLACRACHADAECANNPAGNECLPTGGCGHCAGDADCANNPAGNVCDPTTRVCRQCLGQADCSTNPMGNLCVQGACSPCDAQHVCPQALPFCVTGFCQACNPAGDLGCNGNTSQCVSGSCAKCDPGDNAGCNGQTTICLDRNTCVQCTADGQCAANSNGHVCLGSHTCGCALNTDCPAGSAQCVNGTCSGCNSANNNGCGGGTPLCLNNTTCVECKVNADCANNNNGHTCDLASHTCGCGASDNNCPAAPGPHQCVGGLCKTCDSSDDAGCGNPTAQCLNNTSCVECTVDNDCANNNNGHTCNLATHTCGCGVSDNNCPALPGPHQCVGGTCKTCDNNNDGCSNPTPLCLNNTSCVECTVDNDCANNNNGHVCDLATHTCGCGANDNNCPAAPGPHQCVGGTCKTCDNNNDGCSNPTPLCLNNTTCVECNANADCNGNNKGHHCTLATHTCDCNNSDANCPGALPQCVSNVCQLCDPANDAGCGMSEQCVDVPPPACFICDAGNPNEDRGCTGGTPECVAGVCQVCDPADDSPCAGGTPLCKADGSACVQCLDNGDCNPGIPCSSNSCTPCANNSDCNGYPGGSVCLNGNPKVCGCNGDMDCGAGHCTNHHCGP